ncbi:MAG: C-GCAxxG-C-C family protein [Candidatus Adiutrix sp.]|jgi:C_GCAxxG_C_C family probable redox protein|nr:C-GCAxxG-C-C family protein [Candidatus Adiutrix sp.]
MEKLIGEKVRHAYWDLDINCARTALTCLGDIFQFPISQQTMAAAIGLHGAGGYRAQCGLVEGALMFIGMYLADKGRADAAIAETCYQFAEQFTGRFGSLRCFDLRPNGFSDNDPPHACEALTVSGVGFMYDFLAGIKEFSRRELS